MEARMTALWGMIVDFYKGHPPQGWKAQQVAR